MYPLLKSDSKIKVQPDGINLYYILNNLLAVTSINESAYQILKRCDGSICLEKIINELIELYNEEKELVNKFVHEFIQQSMMYGTVESLKIKSLSKKINIIGDEDFWTPDLVILELTYDCPLNCIHCYAEAGDNKKNEMSFDKLNEVIDEIIELGIEKVQLTGGEPLIYRDLGYFIEKLVSNGIYVNIITSAMIKVEALEILKLLKNNKGSVQVSVDGLEDTHNKYRNNNMSYTKAIELIKFLISNNINVSVASTYINQEFEEIKELCEYLRLLGVPLYRLGMVMDQGRANKNDLDTTNNKFDLYIRMLEKLKNEFDTPSFRILSEDLMIKSNRNIIKNCGAGYRIIKVNPDFFVTPCLMIDHIIGDLKKNTIREILKADNSYYSNISSPSEKECAGCENQVLCKNCIAQGLIQSKSIVKCEWKQRNMINQ
jgi:AdoMet-dependent heme synthase